MPSCRALTQMGTEKESFIELTERIGRKTGGLTVYPFVSSVKGNADPVAFLMVPSSLGPGATRCTPPMLVTVHALVPC